MASAELSRRVGKVVGYPPLSPVLVLRGVRGVGAFHAFVRPGSLHPEMLHPRLVKPAAGHLDRELGSVRPGDHQIGEPLPPM
jgi:hypothetical protein